MPRLIDTKGQLLANPWQLLPKDCTLETASLTSATHLLVPADFWLANKTLFQNVGKQIGLWLDSGQSAHMLKDELATLPLIALNFPGFKDGRSYSTAAVLCQHYQFAGEIRAIGDVLRDQLFLMKRCGFTTFDLKDSVKLEDAVTAFNDFTTNYQATVELPVPLFRRRQ